MYYESFKELREFIESLSEIDELGLPPKQLPESSHQPQLGDMVFYLERDYELAELMIKNWFRIHYPNKKVDQKKIEFVAEVLWEMKNTRIYDGWYGEIQAMCEWFGLSSNDPLTSRLAIFMFGYCWKQISDMEEENE